ncbi:hypothetical protein [Glaciecola sp. HTCC2999]|uniref:hypothetical protein n=1 Tax=Glaciecola sp. HTCC2999 TaxID=455436 RepID=UPI0000E0E652|nr:hypothetical protein [Glaciecola sp. HTCC2999]
MNDKDYQKDQARRDTFLSQTSKTILKIDELIEKRRTNKMSKIKSFYRFILNMNDKST